jgi:uncharacterized damage-inducible protein DinB
MGHLASLRSLFSYSDEMNRRLLAAAEPLTAEQLDRPIDMSLGSLRKTLAHILVGEQMWLERQRGNAEAKWPPYETNKTPGQMLSEFEALRPKRDTFLATIDTTKLEADQPYRDSSGTPYVTTLHEMLLEGIIHSTHHRAQGVHMLKRVGGAFVEVDFMYSVRRIPS